MSTGESHGQNPPPGYPATDRVVDQPLPADLYAVAGSLHTTFDARLGAPAVDVEIHRIAAQFTDAPDRAFVPLFVRRYAGKDLENQSAALPDEGPAARDSRAR